MSSSWDSMQQRSDGIQNLITGQGTSRSDPNLFTRVTPKVRLNQQDQSDLMQYGFLRKVVGKIPEASTTRWGMPTIAEGSQDQINAIVEAMDKVLVIVPGKLPKTGVKYAFYKALRKAFLTGNGAIVIHTDEGKEPDLSQPIDLAKVKSIKRLVVMDRWTISPTIDRGLFGEITHFQTSGGMIIGARSAKIHSSRVLWFEGEEVDEDSIGYSQGCDDSILDGIYDAFVQYAGGIDGASRMLKDFDVTDIGVKDLWNLTAQESAAMQQRATQNVLMQSLYKARIRDMENETITHSTRTVSGYADLLDVLKEWLQANTVYPPAVLFGEFSTGLGASGKTQEERALWNDTIAGVQSSRMTNLLTGRHSQAPGLMNILCAAKDGPTKGKQPDRLGWDWTPLYTPTPTEQALLENSRAQLLTTIGTLDPGFIPNAIASHYGGSVYNPNITLSPEYLKATQDAAAGKSLPQEEVVEEGPIEGEDTGEQFTEEG